MTLKTLRQAFPAFFLLLGLALLLSCSPKGRHEPVLNKPALPGLVPELVTDLEISMRPLSSAAWRVRLKREVNTEWKLVERSDLPGVGDLADSPLIEHFLKTLTTFTTEAKADKGTDESFGFSPYRVEIRLNGETRLSLGDPTGTTGIFFRLEPGAPYLGRGALIALLGHMQSPGALQLKSAFRGRFENYQQLELEKREGKDRGRWAFTKKQERWFLDSTPARRLSDEQQALLERIFRMRILRVVTPLEGPMPVLPREPDWILRIGNEQEISVYFLLDQIFAINPQRGERPVEFYPELAGSLRAFTQAGFTPVKSSIK